MEELIVSVFFADDKIIFAQGVKQDAEATSFIVTKDTVNSDKESTNNGFDDLKIAAEYIAVLSQEPNLRVAGVCLICPTPHTYQIDNNGKEYVQIGNTNVAGWRNIRPAQVFYEALNSIKDKGFVDNTKIVVIDSRAATAFGDRNRRINDRNENAANISINSRYLYLGNDTSIGAAYLDKNGLDLHGRTTPEVGHFIVSRHPDDLLPSVCEFHHHRNCCEGLASLTAVKRWGYDLETFTKLPATHEKVEIVAFYMAQLLANLTLTLSPEIIVIGGRILLIDSFVQHVRGFYDEFLAVKESDQNVLHFPNYSEQRDTKKLIRTQRHAHCGVEGGLYYINRSLS